MPEAKSKWARFRRDLGENRDVYLVWVLGIAVFILGLSSLFRSELRDKWNSGAAVATLGILNVLAWALHKDRSTRSALLHNMSLLLSRSSAARVFESWQSTEVLETIASARQSIVMVYTWFDEWTSLSPLIRRGASRAQNKLDVTLYQLDPSKPFGAQRLAESRKDAEFTNNHVKEFRELVNRGFVELKQACQDIQNASVSARTYRLLSSIRLIIVDDAKFFFSWYPLGVTSQNNSCFLLSVGSQYPADLTAIEHLRRQLDLINRHSAAV